jgi:hypothetical protein
VQNFELPGILDVQLDVSTSACLVSLRHPGEQQQ